MSTLVKYRPLKNDLFTNFDAVVNRFFDDGPAYRSTVPAVDVREDEDRFFLEAELPGMTEKDVNINVENNMLTISSKKEEERNEEKKGYVLKERKSAEFSRSFMLPKNVKAEKIEASMKNGVLNLVIPKAEEAKPKKIEIKAE
jgi:HSP20 family protein